MPYFGINQRFSLPQKVCDLLRNHCAECSGFTVRHRADFAQIRQFAPQLLKIAQKHGISNIYVFGSVARGDNSSQSDVDFLVEMQEGASLFGVAGFSYETEKLLGVPVDVVPLSALPQVRDQEFAINIQREAVPL